MAVRAEPNGQLTPAEITRIVLWPLASSLPWASSPGTSGAATGRSPALTIFLLMMADVMVVLARSFAAGLCQLGGHTRSSGG